MARAKRFSLVGFDAQHYRRTEGYLKAIDAIYRKAVNDVARMGSSIKHDPTKPFDFKQHPTANRQMQRLMQSIAQDMRLVMGEASAAEWGYANQKHDAFIEHILKTSQVEESMLATFQDRNMKALEAFQGRKVNGLGLSDRVWRYTEQFRDQMELGLDIGIGDGRSAQRLSRDLRGYLVDPDRLFRRVRDKHGNLVLSKKAELFHPGQGKYRSSYKNAMRLARTEINMAYREADQLRWRALPFVVGYEVRLSNAHAEFLKEWEKSNPNRVEICDQLAGRYPKEFLFKGWHPQCKCHVVPILMETEDYKASQLERLRAAIRGEAYQQQQVGNRVTDVPQGFKEWMRENESRAKGWANLPRFIRDNMPLVNGWNDLRPEI